jgi:hypothetical protein
VASHLLILCLFLAAQPPPPVTPQYRPVVVELVPPPPPDAVDTPAPPSAAAAPAAPAKSAPRRILVKRAPAPSELHAAAAADDGEADDRAAVLSAGQLAGAASADAGPAGGACDMARWVQGALRKDPLVRAAVAASPGKAIMVWNGDWVRSHGEDGKGLAAVREAIMWEVAFAPEACRSEPVHGLVLFSVNDGSTRLAVGAVGVGQWRWSDLLRR